MWRKFEEVGCGTAMRSCRAPERREDVSEWKGKGGRRRNESGRGRKGESGGSYPLHGRYLVNPTRLSVETLYFHCVCPTVNEGLLSLNLVDHEVGYRAGDR